MTKTKIGEKEYETVGAAKGKSGRPETFSGHIRVVNGVKIYRVYNQKGDPVWVSAPDDEN